MLCPTSFIWLICLLAKDYGVSLALEHVKFEMLWRYLVGIFYSQIFVKKQSVNNQLSFSEAVTRSCSLKRVSNYFMEQLRATATGFWLTFLHNDYT